MRSFQSLRASASRLGLLGAALWAISFSTAFACQEPAAVPPAASFQKDVRPILQNRCWGCHQPADDRGDYVMTQFDAMLAGGASDRPAIVPGDTARSHLLDLVTPNAEGKIEMPKSGDPITPAELEIIQRWILQGAVDDSVAERQAFDADNPPVYSTPPVITALDFSPDGSLLAVNGFHEILLLSTADWAIAGRLIGLSPRIESLQFSPDGGRLLATGGQPGQFGEIQIWNVSDRSLMASKLLTHDAIYGGCWSKDAKSIAFGCADNTVRVFDSTSLDQVLFQGAHNDWVLDVAFSADDSHLMTVGRDMTCKLTEIATNRFIDNVTSITPGALKGGLAAIARHPNRDEIVVGGSDGIPRVYRIFRLTKRVIGDDANMIRQLPELVGRIHAVDISRDSRRILAASSLDRRGQLRVYSYEFDTSLPDNIKAINEKVVTSRTPEEAAALDAYRVAGIQAISTFDMEQSGLYAAVFDPTGRTIAAGGDDGEVFVVDTESGQLQRRFVPVPLTPSAETASVNQTIGSAALTNGPPEELSLPADAVAELAVDPPTIELSQPFSQCQLVVTARDANGITHDITRAARYASTQQRVAISSEGRVAPLANGDDQLMVTFAGKSIAVATVVRGFDQSVDVSFIRDINPLLCRLGCNAGTCHGSQQGKNGFKLSLRGYDPVSDVRSFTDDLRCRRINKASPEDSLMLAKASGAVPHGGGVVMVRDGSAFQLLRNWIANGAKLDLATPRVVAVHVIPHQCTLQQIGERQQFRVVANYSDGSQRDVTALAFVDSGKTDVADVDRSCIATAKRRGDAPILVRYEGSYDTATLTVMGDRQGFVWNDVPTNNRVDELVVNKWRELKIQPSPLCSDADFLRRVYLDLTGLPPSIDEIRQFLADARPTEQKRAECIDRLIGSPNFVDYWTNKWSDLLLVNRKYLGPESAAKFREWIRAQIEANKPYDQFVREILGASGSNHENPAVDYFKIHRTPSQLLESSTHLFLGIRFNCNKCHDHPFERWTQDQYYQTAAFFSQVSLRDDAAASKGVQIGGTDVEPARPLFEILSDDPAGQVRHDRTGKVAEPQFPYSVNVELPNDGSRRQQFATWISSPNNPYFAKSYVNRVWSYLLGTGLIEPVDDIRAGNPPSNPELLEYLTQEFIAGGFDTRHLIKTICNSRTYQLSVETNPFNADDSRHYSHAQARRLPAEVLYDAINSVLGLAPQIPGVASGTRAVQLPDAGATVPNGFLTALGRPARESVCECERKSDLPLGPVMALATGPVVATALISESNQIRQWLVNQPDDAKLIDEIFLRIIGRTPSDAEIGEVLQVWQAVDEDHQRLVAELQRAQSEFESVRPQLETQRQNRISELEKSVAESDSRLRPDNERREAERLVNVATLENQVKAAGDELRSKISQWESSVAPPATSWAVLEPVGMVSKATARLSTTADRRILVTETNGPDVYDVSLRSALKRVTAIRFEALTDPSLPNVGPGFPSNGNFVVNELELYYKADAGVADWVRLPLQSAAADYSQGQFDIAEAIDGNLGEAENGWAVSPRGRAIHWAVFQLRGPVDLTSSGQLRVVIVNQYPNDHQLACFRLSATSDDGPIPLGLPEDFAAILRTPAEHRNDALRKPLRDYFLAEDGKLTELEMQLAAARQPLPPNPELVRLQQALEQARQPLGEPAELVRLKRDVDFSTRQLANRRQTNAEDLAWALINSPSFLFNR